MSSTHHEGPNRICLMCGDQIPEHVLFIDEEAECCSPECMEDYACTLIANYVNWDGASHLKAKPAGDSGGSS